MYFLEFTIGGLPKLANQLLGAHWRTRSSHAKRWKFHVAAKVALHGRPPEPLKKAKVTFIRHSAVEPDSDNLAISFKPISDGLVKSGIILDDKPSVIGVPKFLWIKAPRKEGFITVRVEEIRDAV